MRQPSTEDDAVQITPMMAMVRNVCGGPEIISLMRGAKAVETSFGADVRIVRMTLVPTSKAPKKPMIEMSKIKKGKRDKMLKNAKYPACSTPSCLAVSMIAMRRILNGIMKYLRKL